MTRREQILDAIYAALDELNENLPPARRLARAEGTVLLGEKGGLDSLGLVTLIVAAEQRLGDSFGDAVTLADEKAMSQKHSPFRTVGTLADYTETLLPA